MSDVLFAAAGVYHAALGLGLLKFPERTLGFLNPSLSLIQSKTGLPGIAASGGDVDSLLALVGILQIFIGYIFLWSVYTGDEKCKRNSVSGRFMLGTTCLYTCQSTPHGNSLIAFVGLTSVIPALFLGLECGFGDGNAVDLEAAEAKRLVELRAKTKASLEADKSKEKTT